MGIVIRKAEARDVPQMLALVRELAAFEKEPDAVTVNEAEMMDAGFGKNAVWWGWVAELQESTESNEFPESGVRRGDTSLVGIALCYERYSTWRGRVGYLEDIVVTESVRNQGVGERLFKACAVEAVDRGYHHLTWQVLDWNEGALRFYKRLGAEFDLQWVNGRMTRDSMSKLVRESWVQ